MSSPPSNSPPAAGAGKNGGLDLSPKDIALVVGCFLIGLFLSWLFLHQSSVIATQEQPREHYERPQERRIDMKSHRQNSSFSGASGGGFASPEGAALSHQSSAARRDAEIEAEVRQFAARPSSEEIAHSFVDAFPGEGQRSSSPIELFTLTEELEELPLTLQDFDIDAYLEANLPEIARQMGLSLEDARNLSPEDLPPGFRRP